MELLESRGSPFKIGLCQTFFKAAIILVKQNTVQILGYTKNVFQRKVLAFGLGVLEERTVDQCRSLSAVQWGCGLCFPESHSTFLL